MNWYFQKIKNIEFWSLLICILISGLTAQELTEDLNARTAFQKTYRKNDTTYVTRLYSEPIHYSDARGKYQEIDPQIISSISQDYDYEVTKGGYSAHFKEDPTASDAIRISLPSGTYVSFNLVGIGYLDKTAGTYQLFNGLQKGTPEAKDNEIRYSNVLQGIDLRFQYLSSKLKEELIIRQRGRTLLPQPSQYGLTDTTAELAFVMQLDIDPSLTIFGESENEIGSPINGIRQVNYVGLEKLSFRRGRKKSEFLLPLDYAWHEPLAIDSGKISHQLPQLTRRLQTNNGRLQVITSIPYSWLNRLPTGNIVIDPTFLLNAEATDDTWLENSSVKGSQTLLIVGKHAGYPKKRTVVKFDISSLPSSATVQSANLNLYYYGKHRPSGSSESFVNRTVQAHVVLKSWSQSSATVSYPWSTSYGDFGDPPTYDYLSASTGSVEFTSTTKVWKSIDMLQAVNYWHNGTFSNHGVVLWATNESTDGYDVRMRSSETTNTTEKPYLEINYTLPLKKYFYFKDHLGSTRAVIDDAGSITESYDYYPFGLQMPGRIFISGTAKTKEKFTSKEHDEETRWDYFGARYYNPALGRWFNVDPLGEENISWSPYNYVFNNPLVYVDPTGLLGYRNDSTGVYQWFDTDPGVGWSLVFGGDRETWHLGFYTDNEGNINFDIMYVIASDIMQNGFDKFLEYLDDNNFGRDFFVNMINDFQLRNAFWEASPAFGFGRKTAGWGHQYFGGDGNMSDMRHKIGSFLVAIEYGSLTSYAITSGNEFLGLVTDDRSEGRMLQAILGTNPDTAFHWGDVGSNLIGIQNAARQYPMRSTFKNWAIFW